MSATRHVPQPKPQPRSCLKGAHLGKCAPFRCVRRYQPAVNNLKKFSAGTVDCLIVLRHT